MPVLPPLSWGDNLPLNHLELPPGFQIQELAKVPGARSLVLGEKGTLFVGTRGDKVYAVERGGGGKAGKVRTVAQGLRQPNGVAFRDGALWVAAVDKVFKLPDIEQRLAAPPAPELITADLPDDEPHGWRYARFGPDGRLYLAVGAPAMCANGPPPTPPSGAWAPRASTRSSPRASATRWALPGGRARACCGSRATAATGWATTSPRTA